MPHGKICYLQYPGESRRGFGALLLGHFRLEGARARGDGNLAFDDAAGVSGTWVEEGDRTPDERTRD